MTAIMDIYGKETVKEVTAKVRSGAGISKASRVRRTPQKVGAAIRLRCLPMA
jgi:hypothetical protein